jgi:hypothetical protein
LLRVTRRIFHIFHRGWLAALLLALSFAVLPAQAANGIEFTQAHIESSDEGYRLSATFALELNHTLEDAINHGIPLYFTTEVEMRRPRWYWFDDTAVTVERTLKISKNLLTNEYQAAITGEVQRTFSSLDEIVALLRHPARWVVAERGKLAAGTVYKVGVRMRLDLEYLSKPIQVTELNNADWRLASDWKYFSYKAD